MLRLSSAVKKKVLKEKSSNTLEGWNKTMFNWRLHPFIHEYFTCLATLRLEKPMTHILWVSCLHFFSLPIPAYTTLSFLTPQTQESRNVQCKLILRGSWNFLMTSMKCTELLNRREKWFVWPQKYKQAPLAWRTNKFCQENSWNIFNSTIAVYFPLIHISQNWIEDKQKLL